MSHIADDPSGLLHILERRGSLVVGPGGELIDTGHRKPFAGRSALFGLALGLTRAFVVSVFIGPVAGMLGWKARLAVAGAAIATAVSVIKKPTLSGIATVAGLAVGYGLLSRGPAALPYGLTVGGRAGSASSIGTVLSQPFGWALQRLRGLVY